MANHPKRWLTLEELLERPEPSDTHRGGEPLRPPVRDPMQSRVAQEAYARSRAATLEAAAQTAERMFDGGPATRCPNCGEERALAEAYRRGRADAAKAIRENLG